MSAKLVVLVVGTLSISKNPLINSAVADSVGPIMATIDLFPVLLCVALVKDVS